MVSNEYDFGYNITAFSPCLQLFYGTGTYEQMAADALTAEGRDKEVV
jgi:hypothetical protein